VGRSPPHNPETSAIDPQLNNQRSDTDGVGSIKWQPLPFYGSSHMPDWLKQFLEEKGSSGRTRTYNPPVNSLENVDLPRLVYCCAELFHVALVIYD